MSIKRHAALLLSVFGLVFAVFQLPASWAAALFAVSALLTLIGVSDLAKPRHSVRPITRSSGASAGYWRIRSEIRQYQIADDRAMVPFSRAQRSLVYARDKNDISARAFRTFVSVYKDGYEFIAHSIRPAVAGDSQRWKPPRSPNPKEVDVRASVRIAAFGVLLTLALSACSSVGESGDLADRFVCADGRGFDVIRSDETAIVRFAEQDYNLQARPGSLGQRFASPAATLIVDNGFAAFVTDAETGLLECRLQ